VLSINHQNISLSFRFRGLQEENKQEDYRPTDIWAVGAILFEMLMPQNEFMLDSFFIEKLSTNPVKSAPSMFDMVNVAEFIVKNPNKWKEFIEKRVKDSNLGSVITPFLTELLMGMLDPNPKTRFTADGVVKFLETNKVQFNTLLKEQYFILYPHDIKEKEKKLERKELEWEKERNKLDNEIVQLKKENIYEEKLKQDKKHKEIEKEEEKEIVKLKKELDKDRSKPQKESGEEIEGNSDKEIEKEELKNKVKVRKKCCGFFDFLWKRYSIYKADKSTEDIDYFLDGKKKKNKINNH
jgi:serine/threonine protein kinase